jgi:ATP-dependent DNA helicase RecG
MFSNDYINYLIERGNDEQTQLLSTVKKLPVDFFDTLCAFLNTNGGEILFSYSFENGVTGLTENEFNILEKNIISGINNANKIHPKPRIVIKTVFYHQERLLYLKIPNSQSVHTTNNGHYIYERRDTINVLVDNISDQLRIQERKRFFYPDNKIIRYIEADHFNMDVYKKAMNLILQTRPSHPWLNMDFDQVMKSSGLWRIDVESKESGFTVAAVLLFGKDEVIRAIFPSFRIDALREKDGFDGYYDRETFTTNLIDTYYHLMSFVHKHLPDFFVINNTARIGIRDLMYREVFINFLTHQDYSSGLPAKFAITHVDGTFTANSNRASLNKNIDPNNYQPIPKNPIIGRFLRELGLAEELGFGLKKIAAFVSQFSDEKPQFHDGPTFLASIPPITKKNAGDDDLFKKEDFTVDIPSPGFFPQVSPFRQFPIISNSLNKDRPSNSPMAIFENLSESKKERLTNIILFLSKTKYSTTQILIKQLGVSRETIAREIKTLKEYRLIEFRGALKNGYYYLTENGLALATVLTENKNI